jgi:hypothetical protein
MSAIGQKRPFSLAAHPDASSTFPLVGKMKIMDISDEGLRQRLPLWEALSEFWLDTELTDIQLDWIARAIADSPYTVSEVRLIHDFEVAPAVCVNVASIAGEWAGFDTEWLTSRCSRFARRRASYRHRIKVFLQRPFFWFFTARYWRAVLPRVQKLRAESL